MPYTSHLPNKKFGQWRHDRDTRSQLAQNFRAMYRSQDMDMHGCALPSALMWHTNALGKEHATESL